MSTPENILVVRLSALGDCLHTLPLVDALRTAFPEAVIGWAIGEGVAPLLRDHPQVDSFHVLPRDRGTSRRVWMRRVARFRTDLRQGAWDVALDVHGLTKSGVVTRMSGAPRRIGLGGRESRELNRFFLTERAELPATPWHVVERNLSVLRALGVEPPTAPGPGRLPDYGEERQGLRSWTEARLGGRPFVAFQPGTTWATKIWPESSYVALARRMPERFDLDVVVLWGGKAEERAAQRIVGEADSPRVHAAPPTDLRELAALISLSSLAVGNDSGPIHLAAALGVPTVGIHGATDPARNGPWGAANRAVVTPTELTCRPCWKKTCRRGDLACLVLLPAEAVLEACARVLEAAGGGAGA